MKKVITVIALSVAFVASASAQTLLGNLISGAAKKAAAATTTSSASTQSAVTEPAVSNTVLNTVTNLVSGLAGTVYSAPISLDGTYQYNGVAISVTSSESGIVSNLTGSAITSGIESKADEYLAKVGIKPGVMTFTFNAADNSFVLNCGPLSLPGTYKVGQGEKTVTLTFGKTMQFFCLTGTLESQLSGAKMLFTSQKFVELVKKLASKLGEKTGELKSISSLAGDYDNFRIGFKLAK